VKKGKIYITITPFFPTKESFRGPFIYDQVKAIERNSDFHVVVFKPTSVLHPEPDYEYEGVKVYRFKTVQVPSMVFNGMTNGYNAISFLKKVKEIGINYDDIVVAHGHTAMFAVYALALKRQNSSLISIVQHHDPDPFGIRCGRFTNWGLNAKFKAKVALRLFKKIDVHLSVSKYVENNLISFPGHSSHDIDAKYLSILKKLCRINSFIPKKSIVLYNGVDTKIFYPAPVEHELFTIGCIGNFGDWKDQLTLLKAVKEIHVRGITDFKVILIGSGEEEEKYKRFIFENKLSDIVELRREVQHNKLPAIFNSFDLFVLPSYFEGFGCVFTEAAACGVPFMTCCGQGAAEYIDPSEIDKWAIQPFDYKNLASKIIDFRNNKYRQKLIESYDINVLVYRFLNEILDSPLNYI